MVLTVWAALPVYAKEFKIPLSGQIAGTVLDQSGASIGGASVVLFGAVGLEAKRSLTDQRGRFTLEKVMAADYLVSVQKKGIREVRHVLHLTPGETLQLEFQLNVASIFETVTVSPARGQPHEVFEVLALYSNFAAPQGRFSDNDSSQARIGGLRTRERGRGGSTVATAG